VAREPYGVLEMTLCGRGGDAGCCRRERVQATLSLPKLKFIW
jgi:hypothetical protein